MELTSGLGMAARARPWSTAPSVAVDDNVTGLLSGSPRVRGLGWGLYSAPPPSSAGSVSTWPGPAESMASESPRTVMVASLPRSSPLM